MLSWTDVEELAARVRGLEFIPGPPRSWSSAGETTAWERALSKKDLLALGDRAPIGAVLAIRTADLVTKLAWIQTEPRSCFDSPHFNGYPAVLIDLDQADSQVVFELLSEAAIAKN